MNRVRQKKKKKKKREKSRKGAKGAIEKRMQRSRSNIQGQYTSKSEHLRGVMAAFSSTLLFSIASRQVSV
jgi:hypothetical protein